jgi:hypothetical protein
MDDRLAIEIFGILVLVLGIAVVLSARIFPAKRGRLERWGVTTSLIGIVVWAAGFAI